MRTNDPQSQRSLSRPFWVISDFRTVKLYAQDILFWIKFLVLGWEKKSSNKDRSCPTGKLTSFADTTRTTRVHSTPAQTWSSSTYYVICFFASKIAFWLIKSRYKLFWTFAEFIHIKSSKKMIKFLAHSKSQQILGSVDMTVLLRPFLTFYDPDYKIEFFKKSIILLVKITIVLVKINCNFWVSLWFTPRPSQSELGQILFSTFILCRFFKIKLQ